MHPTPLLTCGYVCQRLSSFHIVSRLPVPPMCPGALVVGGVRGGAQVRPRGESPRCPKRPSTGRACLRAASGAVDAPHRKSRFGVVQVLVVVLDLLRGLGADRDTAEALLVALREMRAART